MLNGQKTKDNAVITIDGTASVAYKTATKRIELTRKDFHLEKKSGELQGGI